MIRREFFKQRQNRLDEYRAKGYRLLEEFMQENNISLEQLIDAGLLQMKTIQSTADVLDYEITKKGHDYFKELKQMQVILVRPNMIGELSAYCATRIGFN